MIAPFQNRYRMAWPFAVPDTFLEIDTTEEFPKWNVAGDWRMPPGKVCDLLTAKEFTFSFEFNSAAFNAEFGEDFPEDVTHSVVCQSGTWKYDAPTGLETYNLDSKWDTQVKLFQRDFDEIEPGEFINFSPGYTPQGFAGLAYFRIFDVPEEFGTNWTFFLVMTAMIPFPTKNESGDYVWGCNGMVNGSAIRAEEGLDIRQYGFSSAGSSYLGINDRGGPAQGLGGSFTDLSISIANHFPA
jgi:hypothetical protein